MYDSKIQLDSSEKLQSYVHQSQPISTKSSFQSSTTVWEIALSIIAVNESVYKNMMTVDLLSSTLDDLFKLGRKWYGYAPSFKELRDPVSLYKCLMYEFRVHFGCGADSDFSEELNILLRQICDDWLKMYNLSYVKSFHYPRLLVNVKKRKASLGHLKIDDDGQVQSNNLDNYFANKQIRRVY